MDDNLNVATTPQETGTTEVTQNTQETIQETTQPTTEQTTQQDTQETPKSFRVKHLHEEKEISFDEAPTYIQKGLDYDRVRAKHEETKPVLSFVEELAKESGMSVNEYLEAARQYRERERIRVLAEREGISEELAERLTTLETAEQERQRQQEQAQAQARQQKEYAEFFDYFQGENGRMFDPANDQIPNEVWEMVSKGRSLVDAYQAHEAKQLKQQLKEMQSKLQIQQTNQANADTTPGSVTGQGEVKSDFINYETFEANKHDKDWVNKNYNKIIQSRAKW